MGKKHNRKRGELLRKRRRQALELFGWTEEVQILKKWGYRPIGITQMYFETTFIFQGPQEANNAYEKLERQLGVVDGWWYSLGDFHKAQEWYKETWGHYPDVVWLIPMKD